MITAKIVSNRLMSAFVGSVLLIGCKNEPNPDALLGSGLGISNTTLFVKNLDSARNYYTNVLGFNLPGSEDFQKGIYDGTLSSAIQLADFVQFELLGINDSASNAAPSFIKSFLKDHEGLRVYSLSTSSADTTFHWLRSQGFNIDSIKAGRTSVEVSKGWSWDDGGPEWRSIAFNHSNPPADLPGFLEFVGLPYQEINNDWKPYAWRKYKYYNHPNGVIGVISLEIVVDDIKTARKEFRKMGLAEVAVNDPHVAAFTIAHGQELHIASPQSSTDDRSQFLKTNGPGVYALRFEVKKLKETQAFLEKKLNGQALLIDTSQHRLTIPRAYAHGVQLEFVAESAEQAALAEIYSFKKGEKLDSASRQYAASLYTKYCELCHGKDREGYAADFAPSLRSHSLMATTQASSNPNFLKYTVSYGRPNTAMAGYAKSQGGPMDEDDIELLLQWLHELSGVEKPVELPTESITGNIALGKKLYNKICVTCHGMKGEGISAPALGNPMLLATASDAYLRYAIAEGRDNTPMPSFKDSLSSLEIDALTAYLRSRASGWNAPDAVVIEEPRPENYVLNPGRKTPAFALREGKYVSAAQVLKALKDSLRMVILDARSKTAWYQTHIPGAIPVPYYDEPDTFIKDMPKDSTCIVVYCACPHAASERVVYTLKRFGYQNAAILDEGILVWAQLGYPVQYGQHNKTKEKTK